MKPIFNTYFLAGAVDKHNSQITYSISLIENITYKIILKRSPDNNPWSMNTSLTELMLSGSQAADEQWQLHFQTCGSEKLQDLFILEGNAVTLEEVLGMCEKFSVNSEKKPGLITNTYILGASSAESVYHPCAVVLKETIKLELSLGTGGKSWGGEGTTIAFAEAPAFQDHFENCNAMNILKLIKEKHYNPDREDMLQFRS